MIGHNTFYGRLTSDSRIYFSWRCYETRSGRRQIKFSSILVLAKVAPGFCKEACVLRYIPADLDAMLHIRYERKKPWRKHVLVLWRACEFVVVVLGRMFRHQDRSWQRWEKERDSCIPRMTVEMSKTRRFHDDFFCFVFEQRSALSYYGARQLLPFVLFIVTTRWQRCNVIEPKAWRSSSADPLSKSADVKL